MDKKYKLMLLALACCSGSMSAQTLAQARKWFTDGDFEKAKPVFQRLVKQAPSNANYNYWYGACCYETGETSEALPYLEKSAQRKVIDGFLYLSKAYYDLYRFDDAITNLEDHIYWLERKKRDTAEADSLMTKFRLGARMIRGVEKVTVIDSFVVDKKDFLAAYKLSKESGTITSNLTDSMVCTRFVNEMNDRMIEAMPNAEGETKLYSSVKLTDQWSKATPLADLNDTGENLNYPFMDSDGITLYYAAQGEGSMGGYDIFITRYNSDDNTYFRPDNIGMPFNSPYNDYMYAVDDFNNLGWFASDRRQPEGKVCIYVFVPNETKDVYDYETTEPEALAELAMLKEIQKTWSDAGKVRIAKQQLAQIMYGEEEQKQRHDFYFVIDDNVVYHFLSDFRSAEARKMFQSLQQKEKDLTTLRRSLEELRSQYASAAQAGKAQMAPGILDKEKRVEELYKEIETLSINIRNAEIKSLTN